MCDHCLVIYFQMKLYKLNLIKFNYSIDNVEKFKVYTLVRPPETELSRS